MKVWQISSFGIDSLEFTERPTPEPGPGEVQVEVHAISLNYRDLQMVKGLYDPDLRLPRIPCSDAAGVVSAVGAGVTQWKVGDRVASIFMQNWIEGPLTPTKTLGALGGDVDGVLAEYIVLKESGLVAIPAHLGFEEAATLPCAGVTAWNALAAGNLKLGSTVLILGTGGVSIFALQFAHILGAKVLGTSSNQKKLDQASTLGMDAGFNTSDNPNWDTWALEETLGQGVDLVVDIGGLGTLPRSLRAIRFGGTVAQVGELAESTEPMPVPLIIYKQAHIQGIHVGSRRDFEEMNKAITLTMMRPVGELFDWAQAREAFTRLEGAGHIGKLVLIVKQAAE